METGYMITEDGSDDHLIKPEGLSEYQVPPPSLVRPVRSTAVSTLNKVSPREIDVNESNNKNNEIAENDEFFGPDEDNGERHLFDFINSLHAKQIRGILMEEIFCERNFCGTYFCDSVTQNHCALGSKFLQIVSSFCVSSFKIVDFFVGGSIFFSE